MPEHPSRDDPSSTEDFCSAKTTREQFRGSWPPRKLNIAQRYEDIAALDDDGWAWFSWAALRARVCDRTEIQPRPRVHPNGPQIPKPEHPLSLPSLFEGRGSTLASTEPPSLLFRVPFGTWSGRRVPSFGAHRRAHMALRGCSPSVVLEPHQGKVPSCPEPDPRT